MLSYAPKVNLPPVDFSVNFSQAPLKIHMYCGGFVAQVARPSGVTSPSAIDAASLAVGAAPFALIGANDEEPGTTPCPPQAASTIAATAANALDRIIDKRIEISSQPHSRVQ